MRHATAEALDTIEGLLEALRRNEALTERKRGIFYRGSRACVHFHEDPAGIFADVRIADTWERFCVTSVSQQRHLADVLETLRR